MNSKVLSTTSASGHLGETRNQYFATHLELQSIFRGEGLKTIVHADLSKSASTMLLLKIVEHTTIDVLFHWEVSYIISVHGRNADGQLMTFNNSKCVYLRCCENTLTITILVQGPLPHEQNLDTFVHTIEVKITKEGYVPRRILRALFDEDFIETHNE